jgi:hypothetical protein
LRRLKRLGRGEKELARSDFQMIPELAGNPFLPRIFEMHDCDGDGYMNAADLRALLDCLSRLANEEARYQCEHAGRPPAGDRCGVCWQQGLKKTSRRAKQGVQALKFAGLCFNDGQCFTPCLNHTPRSRLPHLRR